VVVGDNRGVLLSAGVAGLVYISLASAIPFRRKAVLWLMAGVGLAGWLILKTQNHNHAAGDPLRLDMWRASVEMIGRYPLGVGPGLFAQGYRQFGTMGFNQFADAHNHILTLGAELGITGLLAGGLILCLCLYALPFLNLNRSQRAALAALAGIGAHSLFDSFPVVGWALLVGLYVAYVFKDSYLDLSSNALKRLRAVAVLALVVWTYRMLQFDRAQVFYESALNTGRYYDAYDAYSLDPDLKLYRLEMAHLLDIKSFPISEDLGLYGLTMYGRRFK